MHTACTRPTQGPDVTVEDGDWQYLKNVSVQNHDAEAQRRHAFPPNRRRELFGCRVHAMRTQCRPSPCGCWPFWGWFYAWLPNAGLVPWTRYAPTSGPDMSGAAVGQTLREAPPSFPHLRCRYRLHRCRSVGRSPKVMEAVTSRCTRSCTIRMLRWSTHSRPYLRHGRDRLGTRGRGGGVQGV